MSVWLRSGWVLGAFLVIAVFVVYQPVWWAGYVWDDEMVVTKNAVIIGPLGLKEIWTTSAADICPLTLSTFWIEHKLWGSAPLPYHLVNVLLHGGCALLFWRVLLSLRIPGAWLGAALWALHPVEVESVAWITEMKNTESGFFFLLSVLFFVKDVEVRQRGSRRGWNWNYTLSLLFAVMAMASKSSTVILPVVFCLCVWWIEGRWQWRNLVKVIPVALMSLGAGLPTMWTQKLQVATLVDAQWARPWLERLAIAGDAFWFYLGKLLWPHPLLTTYPRWTIDGGRWINYLPLVAAVIVLSIFWLKRQSWARPCFFAFAYFLAALLPVLGVVNNTFFRFSFVADHFQYLASMGPLALAGAGIARLGKPWLQSGVAGGILILLGILSWQQARIYENEQTLWNYTLAWNPNSWLGQNALGVAEGQTDEALTHYHEALKLNPNYVDAHYNLGVALAQLGRVDEAMAHYQTAVSINPNFAKAHENIGVVLAQNGKIDEAMAQFQKALEINPGYADAHYNLGLAFFEKGRRDEAVAHLQQAIKFKLDFAAAHSSLGLALVKMGRPDEATVQLEEAVRLNPADGMAQKNLAEVKSRTERGGNPK